MATNPEQLTKTVNIDDLHISKDNMSLLRRSFKAFDINKKGVLGLDMVGTILEMLGHILSESALIDTAKEIDVDGSGELDFGEFCLMASKFLGEDEVQEEDDSDMLISELKEIFRYYDIDGLGFISTTDFKEILRELDDNIPEKDLVGMVSEIDFDDSGTIDFEEFQRALR